MAAGASELRQGVEGCLVSCCSWSRVTSLSSLASRKGVIVAAVDAVDDVDDEASPCVWFGGGVSGRYLMDLAGVHILLRR